MISDKSDKSHKGFVPTKGSVGRLFINDIDVGKVVVDGWDSSWSRAHFTPAAAFAKFAALFGRWSLIMHDDEHAPLHESAVAALADAERDIDSLHAKIYFPEHDAWHNARQLNIDGDIAEWKEF